MNRKDWLLKQGYITAITRGRISLENHRRIDEAVKSGVVFSDYTGPTSKPSATKSVKSDKPHSFSHKSKLGQPKVRQSRKEVVEPFIRYEGHIDDYVAVTNSGKRYSLREACKCGYSLIGHVCDHPTVLGEPVEIRREKITR